MHLTDPILQRHDPVPQDRDAIIALLSMLYHGSPEQSLTLRVDGMEPVKLGFGTLQAIRGLLAVLARPSAASIYVVDHADYLEGPQVCELLGLTNQTLYAAVHDGTLPSLRDAWKRAKRAHNPFSADIVLNYISAAPDAVARSSALVRAAKQARKGGEKAGVETDQADADR